ncbi:hypothetical protein [Microbacterium sp. 2MCAF23]|uniref:hypothetical protein n=1 Tax=Microbacterium sp. 2MCAF23 TaxID=3232985 RepID=UPI003F99820A
MPTFTDATADAAEAAAAMRGVAHAIRQGDHPRQAYPLIGELLATVRRLDDVLDQLSGVLVTSRHLATNDHGNIEAGAEAVQDTVNRLQHASALADDMEQALERASRSAATIAWRTPPTSAMQSRYVNVVFLQGEEADEVLDIIQLAGTSAGIEHLAGHDHGAETVDAALENGYVYTEPPVAKLDRTATNGAYTIVYNPFLSYVGLYRQHDQLPDPALVGIDHPTPATRPSGFSPSATSLEVPARRDRLGNPNLDDATTSDFASTRDLAL